jgi:hypothetical protein
MLLNLADRDIHDVTAGGQNCKLKVRRKGSGSKTDQVWMRVPRAILTVSPPDETKNCWLWEFGTLNLICKESRATKITLRFQFEGTLQVKACRGNDCSYFDKPFTGTDLKFTINNKCMVDDGVNDSLDFYDCVRDGQNEPGKRFFSSKLSIPCMSLETMEAEDNVADLIQEILKPDSNCDPVLIEPPPIG